MERINQSQALHKIVSPENLTAKMLTSKENSLLVSTVILKTQQELLKQKEAEGKGTANSLCGVLPK